MVLHVTTDYAIRILTYLSITQRRASAREIAEKMDIPSRYIMADVIKKLKSNGAITSALGRGGGFYLARPAAHISLADIVAWMEPEDPASRCGSCDPDCQMHEKHGVCPVNSAYGPVKAAIEAAFAKITIQDLAKSNACVVNLDGGFP